MTARDDHLSQDSQLETRVSWELDWSLWGNTSPGEISPNSFSPSFPRKLVVPRISLPQEVPVWGLGRSHWLRPGNQLQTPAAMMLGISGLSLPLFKVGVGTVPASLHCGQDCKRQRTQAPGTLHTLSKPSSLLAFITEHSSSSSAAINSLSLTCSGRCVHPLVHTAGLCR
jgi:hypothetical protein